MKYQTPSHTLSRLLEPHMKHRTHDGLDGVRHPEGHEAVAAVAVEVVDVMEEAEGDPGLEHPGGAERLVEATQLRFSAWMEKARTLISKRK